MHQEPSAQPPGSSPIQLDEHTLRQLMQQIEQTHQGMYSCAETFALLDEYAELVVAGSQAAQLMPLVEKHLAHCPGCNEEYEILRAILAGEKDS